MKRPSALPRKLLYWVAALSLVMGQLVLNAQNSSAKRSAPRNDRQKMAALKEAQRLSLKAETYEKQGKPAEAERTAERALALEEQARGAWHIDVAHRLDQVADLYTAHKKERAAESLYERARAIREQALSRHPDVYERDGGEIRARRNQPAEKALEPLPKTRQQ